MAQNPLKFLQGANAVNCDSTNQIQTCKNFWWHHTPIKWQLPSPKVICSDLYFKMNLTSVSLWVNWLEILYWKRFQSMLTICHKYIDRVMKYFPSINKWSWINVSARVVRVIVCIIGKFMGRIPRQHRSESNQGSDYIAILVSLISVQ